MIWSDAYAHIPKSKRHKLESRSKKLKLIGYHTEKKAYRLWNQENDRIEISHDVIFDESIILNNEVSTLSNIADDEYIIDAIIGERIVNNEKEYLFKWLRYDEDTWEQISHVINTEALIDWNDRSHQYALLTKYISIDDVDPENYQDALSRPEAPYWQQAITSELNSLKDNDTWTIISHDQLPGS